MDTLLIFGVRTIIRMLDPLTWVAAIAFGGFAASRVSTEVRVATIGVGAVLILLAGAALSGHLSALEGSPFRFYWVPYGLAALLQVSIATAAIWYWRNRSKKGAQGS